MRKFKKIMIFFLIFLFFLFLNVFINQLQNDEIWNYGFAYNIYKGLLPYKDFNMVLTPLYPFLMSLPFHLFGTNLIVFHIVNAIILTIMTVLVYQMVGNKIYLLGLLVVLFSNSVTFPSYNLFLLFLLVLILYLEKREKDYDFLIGFLIACIFLTKQSVGVFVFFTIFFYFKKKKRFFKRMIGFLLPCFFFLLYLIFTSSLYEFFDLCLFGLFDFGTKNSSGSILGYLAFILSIILHILLIRKDSCNIDVYYSFAFSSLMIPLFDLAHSIGPYLILILVYFIQHPFENKISLPVVFYVSTFFILLISFVRYHSGYEIIYPNSIPHFEYRMIREDSLELTNKVLDYTREHENQNIVFLNSSAYYFRLITNTKISYIDLTNNGNFGYHGSKKMIKEIQKYKGSYIFINMEEYEHNVQTDRESIEYVMEHAKKVDSLWIYDIYDYQ